MSTVDVPIDARPAGHAARFPGTAIEQRSAIIGIGLAALAAAAIVALASVGTLSFATEQAAPSVESITNEQPAIDDGLTLEEKRARWYEQNYAGRNFEVPEWMRNQGPRHPEP